MAGSSSSNPSSGPKILLAKPGLVSGGAVGGKFGRGEDETAPHVHPHPLRSRLPSLNLLSDSWDFHIDRFLPVTHTLKHSLFINGSIMFGKYVFFLII